MYEEARQRETELSKVNAKKIEKVIQQTDPKISVAYAKREGFYYLARKGLTPKDKFDAAVMENESAMFSDAAKRGELVIGYPIPTKMMERYDACVTFCLRHLYQQDMWRQGGAQAVEEDMDSRQAQIESEARRKASDERSAYGRQFYRDFLRVKSYIGMGKRG